MLLICLRAGRAAEAINDIPITFKQTPVFRADTDVFNEDLQSPGSIANQITLSLEGDVFNRQVSPYPFVDVENIPLGLNLEMAIVGNDLVLTLKEEARRHQRRDSIDDLRLSFTDGLFAGGVKPADVTLSVNYKDTSYFIKKGSFVEDGDDTGAISNQITLYLAHDTLEDVNPNDYIKTTGLPAGLQARFERLGTNSLAMRTYWCGS